MYIYILCTPRLSSVISSKRVSYFANEDELLAVDMQMTFFIYFKQNQLGLHVRNDRKTVLFFERTDWQYYTPTTQWSDSSMRCRFNGPTVLISDSCILR